MALFQQFKFINRCLALLILLGANQAFAQTEQTGQYFSQVDSDLTIRKIAVLQVSDNLEGIYARPLEAELTALIRRAHQWDYVETNFTSSLPNMTAMEQNPALVKGVIKTIPADAFIAAAISKSQTGVNIRLNLFLKVDGKLLAQELLSEYPKFEIPDLKQRIDEMFHKLVTKIPYEGLILSRKQNQVTINLGKSDGLDKDQVLTVVQIIKVVRHPKFNFLVNAEKEILGKVKITKVDETLSFGNIVSEKERGTIKRLAKIASLDFINYTEPVTEGTRASLDSRTDKTVAFGNDAKEWLPTRPPSFGQVGMKLGLGSFQSSISLTNPSGSPGSLSSQDSVFPSLSLFGELWFNPNWTLRTDITQGLISVKNPRSDSTPSTLNMALSRYSLVGAYNFLLRGDFFGPKIQIRSGLSTYRLFVDDSQPRAFTTVNYTGFLLGLFGSLPVTEDGRWTVGAGLNLTLFSKLSESPETSGDKPHNTITDFTVFGEHKLRENINLIGSIDFSAYSTTFSGGSGRSDGDVASSLSQRMTTFNLGAAYLF